MNLLFSLGFLLVGVWMMLVNCRLDHLEKSLGGE